MARGAYVFGTSAQPSASGSSRLEEIMENLKKYGVGFPSPEVMQQIAEDREARHRSTSRHEPFSPGDFRRSEEAAASAASAPSPLTLADLLMGSQGGATQPPNPYNIVIQGLRNESAQVGAQTGQNIADIGSWFGQLGGSLRRGAKANKRAARGARRGAKRFAEGLLGGIADPNVSYGLRKDAASEGAYLAETALENARFDRSLMNDAQRQESYQRLVQQRLGAQAQADIRSKIAEAKAQKRMFRFEQQSAAGEDQRSMMMSLLGMLPDDKGAPIIAQMLGLDPRMFIDAPEDSFDRDARGDMSGALSAILGDVSEQRYGEGDFENILGTLRTGVGAGGAGFDLSDPRIREAFQSWIAANFLNLYNSQNEGTDFAYRGGTGGFRPIPGG